MKLLAPLHVLSTGTTAQMADSLAGPGMLPRHHLDEKRGGLLGTERQQIAEKDWASDPLVGEGAPIERD
jgi:hypothetical protein